ncbi:hypothetical protein KSP40_PGU016040 [Platanthera guangdongensis]|uniref:Uncharacterized protein n=1 Tax=Platanthera guangdongensis TaxID=2320717 RepID=A0ABR2MWA7_9ASPA
MHSARRGRPTSSNASNNSSLAARILQQLDLVAAARIVGRIPLSSSSPTRANGSPPKLSSNSSLAAAGGDDQAPVSPSSSLTQPTGSCFSSSVVASPAAGELTPGHAVEKTVASPATPLSPPPPMSKLKLILDNLLTMHVVATHVALKQELNASHNELVVAGNAAARARVEWDAEVRDVLERSVKAEAWVHDNNEGCYYTCILEEIKTAVSAKKLSAAVVKNGYVALKKKDDSSDEESDSSSQST